MLHKVKKVEYLENYKLRLHFDDRSIKTVDLESMLGRAKNMFISLKNTDYFKQVKCDGVTIHWPNGVDLCPDVLYKMGTSMRRPAHRSRTASRKIRVSAKPKRRRRVLRGLAKGR